jgi:hypothetical protein
VAGKVEYTSGAKLCYHLGYAHRTQALAHLTAARNAADGTAERAAVSAVEEIVVQQQQQQQQQQYKTTVCGI